MRKKLFTFLLALATSVGLSWAVPTEFANCYDCWRSPEYPNISGQCHLFNFGNPGVGNGNPSGPWKLEFVEYYNSSSTEYDDIVSSYAANQYGKSPEQMEVYRLYQWQNGAYQPVAYGVLYAYANENNAVEHAAFFEANGYWGCYFTDNTHSGGDDFNITFNEDASTGFADLHGSTPTPTPSGDKLSGVFSISADKAVNFSKGNLQYDSDNQIWQFAANQWDYIGNAAGNNAITSDGIADNNGIVDMFCWVGASSSLEGIKQYGIIKSWSGYGSVAGEALKSDWGNIMGGDWRTLSKDEWIYLLTERTNAANLRTLGTVNGKAGLILMPDGWTASGVALTVTTANYTTNDINTTNWATLEGQGCAFLPAAGCCMSGLFDGVGGDGSYWSSTSRASGSTHAHRLHFRATDVDPTDFVERFTGMSVRLVSETVPTPTSAGLQVTKLEIPDSWQNDPTLVTISDLPGFVAVSLEEAGAWDAVPAGDVVLIYAGTNEGVTATYFHNGAWGDPVPFGGFSRADIFEWASGSKIFYTSGGSTPAVDPAVQNVIALINAIPNPVAYNDECKDAIDAARAAYDALTDAQNDLVENYGVLLDAETAYALLTPNPSGECGAQGDNLLWELNTSTGVLTITGSGAMYDWSYDTDLPWYDNRLQITSVVLPSGITSLGTKAFRGCQNLASINMTENYPAGLTAINQEAFCHTALTSVTIPKSVVTIGQDAFYQSQSITDVYCYADPNNLTWTDFWGDDFASAKSTQCHVKDCYLEVYNSKWNTGTTSTDVNVTFVGDLPGECGGSSEPEEPVVSSYSIALDGEMANADKITLSGASAEAGETVTVTPAAGYQITSLTASYGSYAVRIANNQQALSEAEPQMVSFPREFTVDVTPGKNGATFTNITNDGGQIEYVGMNDAKDQMTFRVNGAFSGTASIAYQYTGQECVYGATWDDELEDWVQDPEPSCSDVPKYGTVLISCEQSGGVAEASKNEETGVWSFTMPAGNVTITATVEAIPEPVVTNYAVSLDIAENADKVTLSAASAVEGATVTLTPAEGYQITSFTASYASAYSVRVTADPNVNVYDATPYVGALPKEFTENVTPGLNGATFHSIEGDDPFTPVPASVLEYVGMNAAKDQMTIRVNDAFSGIIRVNYTYNVETCEWDEYSQQEICMGGTAQASVRVVCEAAGGVAPASKDAVTGAYSFTMPAGNVTITATVEAIPEPAPTAVETGDNDDAETINAKLQANDGQTVDEWTIVRPVYRNTYYNTLCLPFDMDAAQIAASSIAGAEIKEFTGAEVVGDELLIDLAPVDEIEAGKPYFIKYSNADALTQLDFTNVTIDATAPQGVTFNGVTLQGTFVPFLMEAQSDLNYEGGYLFLGQNNQLFWPGVTNSIKPFRAYFYVDTTPSNQNGAPKRYGMPARFNEEQVATSIGNVQGDKVQSTKVLRDGQLIIIRNGVEYNANGMMVK